MFPGLLLLLCLDVCLGRCWMLAAMEGQGLHGSALLNVPGCVFAGGVMGPASNCQHQLLLQEAFSSTKSRGNLYLWTVNICYSIASLLLHSTLLENLISG